jgi:hypothetical protein
MLRLFLLLFVVSVGCKDGADAPAKDTKDSPPTAAATKSPANVEAANEKEAKPEPKPEPEPEPEPSPKKADALPETGIRLVWIHDHELLKSEVRATERLTKTLLKKTKIDVEALSRSGPETEGLREFLAGKRDEAQLPDAWASAKLVVVVEVPAPEGKKPKRIPAGPGGSLVFMPPNMEPVFSMQATDMHNDRSGAWRWETLEQFLVAYAKSNIGGAK